MAGGLRWNFQFSPLSDGAASGVQSKSLAWDNLGKGIEKLAQLGQQWASRDVDEFYKDKFARASDEQKMQWLQNGGLIAPEHAQQVSPQLREAYRNASPEAAAQWAKTADEWQQRRDAQAAWQGVGAAAQGAASDPHGQNMAAAMMRAAAASRNVGALAQLEQLQRQRGDDATLARALQQFDGSGEQVQNLGRWLDPDVARLQYGAPDARGFVRPQAVPVPEEQRAQQLHWGQQASLAAAQQLLARNPTAALAMVQQVNQQRADSMKNANAVVHMAGDGGNELAWRGAQLNRQDAQLAETRRHNRAGEGLQAQRLQWELNRPQGAAGGAASEKFSFNAQDVSRALSTPQKALIEGQEPVYQRDPQREADFYGFWSQNPDIPNHQRALQAFIFNEANTSRQQAENRQKQFNADEFARQAMLRGATPEQMDAAIDMAVKRGLQLSEHDVREIKDAARRNYGLP